MNLKILMKVPLFFGVFFMGFLSQTLLQNTNKSGEYIESFEEAGTRFKEQADIAEQLATGNLKEKECPDSLGYLNLKKITAQQKKVILKLREDISLSEGKIFALQNELENVHKYQLKKHHEKPILVEKNDKARKTNSDGGITPEDIDSKESEDKFLQHHATEQLFKKIQELSPPENMEGVFGSVQGVFNGEILNKNSEFYMSLNLNIDFTEVSGALKGRYRILSEGNGNRSSRNSDQSDGSNTFWVDSGKNFELLIKISPDSYVQLFYLKASDRFIGNYYESGEPGSINKVGSVKLDRAG